MHFKKYCLLDNNIQYFTLRRINIVYDTELLNNYDILKKIRIYL